MNSREGIRYRFIYFSACNFCKTSQEEFKSLGLRLNKRKGFFEKPDSAIAVSVVKCKNCGLIFCNPMPLPENINDHYNISPDSYWKEDYFNEDDNYFGDQLKILKRLSGGSEGKRALDIGSGIGKGVNKLERSGFETYAIEPSEAFFNAGLKNGIQKERAQNVSLEDAEFEEEFFDFINFGAILEHVSDPDSSIRKCLKWLKKGGFIHIEVPNSEWLSAKIARKLHKLTGSDTVVNLSPLHPPFHLFEFSLRSFILHGNEAGYIVADRQFYVCETHLPRILDPVIKPLMRYTNTGMQLAVWLKKNELMNCEPFFCKAFMPGLNQNSLFLRKGPTFSPLCL